MAQRIAGLEDLSAQLRGLSDPKEIGKTLRKGVRAGMQQPLQRARQLIPKGDQAHLSKSGRILPPGFASRNIKIVTKVDRSGQMAYALLGVAADAYYAVQFVELGTSTMGAQPWLRPAFASSTDAAIRQVGGAINDWIKGVAARKRAAGQTARANQLEASAALFDPSDG